ncbi:MAG: hypothetical protein WC977_12865 [Anaerovoracaceae bacterium]
MSQRDRRTCRSVAELISDDRALLPLWPDAGQHIAGRSKVYEMHRTGTFPVPVLKVGGRYKVRRADLLAFLGLERGS